MFDLARAISILYALAGWARTRDAIGGAALLVMATLFAWDVGAPLAGHATGDSGTGAGFGFVFLGPLSPFPS